MTEQAAKRDAFVDLLKKQIGFTDGLDEKITTYLFPTSRTVLEWLRTGSTDEDSPTCRAANHFHDPLKAWTDSYVTDSPAMIQAWCRDVPPVWPTYSNITWATGYEVRDKKLDSSMDRQDMNWDNAHSYFYSALTETDHEKKEDYFVKTFRAIGQILHLLQDMAVPAHVRNDFRSHLAFNGIKGNSLIKPMSWYGNAFEYYVKLHSGLISSAAPDVPAFSNTRVTDFWDTDGNGTASGLAEFTSAYFFSDETIAANNPTPEHTYSYPTFDNAVTPKNVIYPNNETKALFECIDTIMAKGDSGKKKYQRKYLSRSACPTSGGEVDHFMASSFINNNSGNSKKLYVIDNNVHDTYAKNLLPKAIGYSAALLDYFFRGKIKLTIADPRDITFGNIKVTAENDTTGEDMGLGEVSLVIRYKPLEEESLGGGKYLLKRPPEDSDQKKSISDYTYKVFKLSDKVDLKESRELTFDLSNDPLPLFSDDMSMQVVYKGPLGKESESVVVSPLTPIKEVYVNLVSLPSSGVYAKVTGDSVGGSFDELRVVATTDAPGGLSGGNFTLVVEHSVATSDPFQSVPVTSEPVDDLAYLIKAPIKNGVSSLAQNVPAELVFDLSGSPLPVKATDVLVNVIYTWPGDNKYSVVGYKDIAEPTPVDIFNNSDKSCVGGTWFNSGDEALQAADKIGNSDGVYNESYLYSATYDNIYLKFGATGTVTPGASEANNNFSCHGLKASQMKRLGYILTDYQFDYTISGNGTNSAGMYTWLDEDVWHGHGFMNQQDKGWNLMGNIRGLLWWPSAGTYLIPKPYPADATCKLSDLK